jgi:hypothetical protein
MARAYLAAVLWTTGCPDASRARGDESRALADELGEPICGTAAAPGRAASRRASSG